VRAAFGEAEDGRLGRAGRDDLGAAVDEVVADGVADGGVVVDDENADASQ
jgi:hypothetical protein